MLGWLTLTKKSVTMIQHWLTLLYWCFARNVVRNCHMIQRYEIKVWLIGLSFIWKYFDIKKMKLRDKAVNNFICFVVHSLWQVSGYFGYFILLIVSLLLCLWNGVKLEHSTIQSILLRKRLFARSNPGNKNLFTGAYPEDKNLFFKATPEIKNLFAGPPQLKNKHRMWSFFWSKIYFLSQKFKKMVCPRLTFINYPYLVF